MSGFDSHHHPLITLKCDVKTPEEWLAVRTYALNDGDGVFAELNKWIAAIQREAYQEGHKDGVEQGHEDWVVGYFENL